MTENRKNSKVKLKIFFNHQMVKNRMDRINMKLRLIVTKKKMVVVNATENWYLTTINATEGQLDNIERNGNFGLDTRLHENSEVQNKLIINLKLALKIQ